MALRIYSQQSFTTDMIFSQKNYHWKKKIIIALLSARMSKVSPKSKAPFYWPVLYIRDFLHAKQFHRRSSVQDHPRFEVIKWTCTFTTRPPTTWSVPTLLRHGLEKISWSRRNLRLLPTDTCFTSGCHIPVCLSAKHFNRIAKSVFSCVTWPWYPVHVPIETNSDCRPKRDFLGNKINRILALKLKGRILYHTCIIYNRGSNAIFGQHLSVDL